MSYEVEQKHVTEDLAAKRRALEELDARFSEPVVQVDRYFAHPARDFARTDEALRVRSVGPRNFVTYKGPKVDETTKTRREIELPLAEGDQGRDGFSELLVALGFEPVAEVRKKRTTAELVWRDLSVEAALDEVEGLGAFVELEIEAEEDALNQARDAIASLAERLKLGPGERRSYLELLLPEK